MNAVNKVDLFIKMAEFSREKNHRALQKAHAMIKENLSEELLSGKYIEEIEIDHFDRSFLGIN